MREHPGRWQFCGYNEIQDPPRRYRIIDLDALASLVGCTDLQELQSVHKNWVKASLRHDEPERQSHWTQSIASGSKPFVEEVKKSLGFKARGKYITHQLHLNRPFGVKRIYQYEFEIL